MRMGAVLAAGCGLRGLFGVDGVLRDGAFWPVEVNPRYTASVEVLEYATGLSALGHHRRAFDESAPVPAVGPATGVVGKAILYARASAVFPADGPWRATLEHRGPVTEMPAFADLPHAGNRVEAGRPVLTLLVRAATEEACLAALRTQADEVERGLYS